MPAVVVVPPRTRGTPTRSSRASSSNRPASRSWPARARSGSGRCPPDRASASACWRPASSRRCTRRRSRPPGRGTGCGSPSSGSPGASSAAARRSASGNRFPAGMVYAPVPEPKSALLASPAAMLPSLTLMRISLPRRSLEFSAPRRESPVGRWYQPPSCCVVTAAVGVVAPVRAAPSIVSCAWSDCCLAAAEEHVQVRRVGRAAAGLDLVRLDVRERLERGVDVGPRAR